MAERSALEEVVEQLLSVKQLTAKGYPKKKVYQAIDSGELRAVWFGRVVRIPASAIAEWTAAKGQRAA